MVAFSADAVYAIAELIRRQRGGAAVVMGSLSPRTRNAQVALYQSGEVDFLVATDAIGMGLNMDVDHVAFAGLRKHDGRRTRWLHPHEIGQIAGRAGRYRTDGTFGITGDCPDMDPDLVSAVENHRFEPVRAAEWRNARLDFQSLGALVRSLAMPPQREGLKLAEQTLDETTLLKLAEQEDVRDRCRNRDNLFVLWEACQTPDFHKTSFDEHMRLVRTVFDHLTTGRRRMPDDWIDGQMKPLDRLDGDIDALAARLARVRTLSYAANRPAWLADPAHWQARTRALEDRLSDTLHERLMQRFIDRRTSALMRGPARARRGAGRAGDDGAVTVEGHYVGRLRGVRFDPARAPRRWRTRPCAPPPSARWGRRSRGASAGWRPTPTAAFALQPDGMVLWRGEGAGQLSGGEPFSPACGCSASSAPPRRASGRRGGWRPSSPPRRAQAGARCGAWAMHSATAGCAAWRAAWPIGWWRAGGVIDRTAVDADIRALSSQERRALRGLGVKIGAFSIYLPALLSDRARGFAAAFAASGSKWIAPQDRISPLPSPAPSARALSLGWPARRGAAGGAVEALERLDAVLRAAPRQAGAAVLAEDAMAESGWSPAETQQILRALGFAPVGRPKAASRRPGASAASAPPSPTASPRRPTRPSPPSPP